MLCSRTNICSCKISSKVPLMLENPFPVPFLCKLNYTSVCFIHISTKITCKKLITFRRSHVVFEVIPRCFELLVNFNITQRFLLRRHVFPDYLSVSCDHDVEKYEKSKLAVLQNRYSIVLSQLKILCRQSGHLIA